MNTQICLLMYINTTLVLFSGEERLIYHQNRWSLFGTMAMTQVFQNFESSPQIVFAVCSLQKQDTMCDLTEQRRWFGNVLKKYRAFWRKKVITVCARVNIDRTNLSRLYVKGTLRIHCEGVSEGGRTKLAGVGQGLLCNLVSGLGLE